MAHGKFGINLISNVLFFVLNIVFSLWLVSYLVRQLGVAAYGMVPLAVTIASYFNVITAGLNAAVGRYLTVALSQGEGLRASVIFNSSLWASCVVGLLMSLFGWLAMSHLAHWINVPDGLERDAGWLFLLTVAGLAITTIGTPFQAVVYSHNRFDLQNLGNICGLAARAILLLMLFHLSMPQLWHVGVSVFGAALVTLAIVVWSSRRLAPQLEPRMSGFSWPVLKEISSTGGWIFISQVGTLLLVNIDLVVANKVVGATAAGQYALVLQWSLLLRNFSLVIGGVFGPTMMALHAEGKTDELIAYSKRAVRFMGLLMAVPVGLLCGLSEGILRVWLGPEMAVLAGLMILATGHLALNLAYLPLHGISMATNHVKWPGIVQVAAGVLNLVLAIVLARAWGLYGIAIAGALVLLMRNLLFTPIYAAKILDRSPWLFMREVLPVLLLTVLVFLVSWGVSCVSPIHSLQMLIVSGSGIIGIFLPILWLFFLRPTERDELVVKISQKLKSI